MALVLRGSRCGGGLFGHRWDVGRSNIRPTREWPPLRRENRLTAATWRPMIRRMQRRSFWKVCLLATAAFGSMTLAAADLPTATPESVGMSAARLSRLDTAVQADITAGRL